MPNLNRIHAGTPRAHVCAGHGHVSDPPHPQVMTAILTHAEHTAQAEGGNPASLSLMLLLQAYDVVLRKNGIVPEEDTRYYRFLLKLSLEPYPSWWDKLQV